MKAEDILFEEEFDAEEIISNPKSESRAMEGILEDGAMPLNNPAHEKFAYSIFCGENQTRSYSFAYPDASDSTASNESTKLAKRPEIKARIKWLNKYLAGADLDHERKYAIKVCSRTMRNSNSTWKEKAEAMEKLAKIGSWYRESDYEKTLKSRPDPAYLMSFLQKVSRFTGHSQPPQGSVLDVPTSRPVVDQA